MRAVAYSMEELQRPENERRGRAVMDRVDAAYAKPQVNLATADDKSVNDAARAAHLPITMEISRKRDSAHLGTVAGKAKRVATAIHKKKLENR